MSEQRASLHGYAYVLCRCAEGFPVANVGVVCFYPSDLFPASVINFKISIELL